MTPRFSVVIPVINEEAVINEIVTHLTTLAGSTSQEIIVVDGDLSGKTIGAIRDKKVKTAIGERGRGNQMNAGAAVAAGDILVFLHADTRLPVEALSLIEAAFGDSGCPAGAFDLAIASGRPVYRMIETVASLRSRLTHIPYGDQAHFFRRDYFAAIGGYADISLMEDVEIMRRIKRRGDKIAIIGRPVTTSARRWEQEGVFRCTLRNWLLISLYLAGVAPERLARFYR